MKRLFTFLLAMLMLLGVLAPALAANDNADTIDSQSLPFADVPVNAWYFPYVQTVFERDVMTGTSPTTFAPHSAFSRAQVLTMLFRFHHGRIANESDPRSNNFSDVSTDWYAPYVTWAANNGITMTTSGVFSPNQAADRQTIALFLHRYVASLTGLDSSSTATTTWNAFADRSQIAGADAYNAIRWANNNGLINGRTATTIVPTGTTIRAEAATLLVRFSMWYEASRQSLTWATVSRVIDGDTLELSTGERVRLIGVDAPEIGQPSASEATQFVRNLVEGRTVWLEADGNDTDAFGRLRRYVWLSVPTDVNCEQQVRTYMLNALLLEHGHASVMIIGNVRHEALFRRIAPTPQPTPTPSPTPAPTPTPTGPFIGNRNSLIFHISTCSTLPAPQNRVFFNTREAAIDAGFRPCRRCNP